jgi:ABC-type Na+ efflux pump permease subunit
VHPREPHLGVREGGRGVDFKTFIYPGVLSMSVLFTAIFSAATIVWDREFGFLREMLVAPVSRSVIVIGKCLGGATVSTFQGIVILCLAGLAGVLQPDSDLDRNRRTPAAVVHADRVLGNDGGQDKAASTALSPRSRGTGGRCRLACRSPSSRRGPPHCSGWRSRS